MNNRKNAEALNRKDFQDLLDINSPKQWAKDIAIGFLIAIAITIVGLAISVTLKVYDIEPLLTIKQFWS